MEDLRQPLVVAEEEKEGIRLADLSSSDVRRHKVLAMLAQDVVDDGIDARLRLLNLQMTLFATIGVLLVVIANEVCFDEETLIYRENLDCGRGVGLSILGWFASLCCIWRLVVYYQTESLRRALMWGFPNKRQAFLGTSLKFRFAAEFAILVWSPVPFTDVWGSGHKVVLSMMLLRFYLLVRVARDHSDVWQFRHQVFSSNSNSKKRSQLVNVDTVVKTAFHTHSVITVLGLLLLGLITLSYATYVVEREFWIPVSSSDGLSPTRGVDLDPSEAFLFEKNPLSKYGNAFWFMVATTTTLGYGDITPAGWQGRFFASVGVFSGIILTSLVVGVVSQKLQLSSSEKHAMSWLALRGVRIAKEKAAARIIEIAWRHHRLRARTGPLRLLPALRVWIKRLRKAKKDEHELLLVAEAAAAAGAGAGGGGGGDVSVRIAALEAQVRRLADALTNNTNEEKQ